MESEPMDCMQIWRLDPRTSVCRQLRPGFRVLQYNSATFPAQQYDATILLEIQILQCKEECRTAGHMCKELEWSNKFLKCASYHGGYIACKLGTCNSSGERHLRTKCAIRNITCKVCGRCGHISFACRGGEQREPNFCTDLVRLRPDATSSSLFLN